MARAERRLPNLWLRVMNELKTRGVEGTFSSPSSDGPKRASRKPSSPSFPGSDGSNLYRPSSAA